MQSTITSASYIGDGSTSTYSFNFEYLRKEFITVTVDENPVSFEFVNLQTITLASPVPQGAVISISRNTDTRRIVTFVDGSILRARDLNTSQIQVLHIAEEAVDVTRGAILQAPDGTLRLGNRRITTDAEPLTENDLVTRGWIEDISNSVFGQVAYLYENYQDLSIDVVSLPQQAQGYAELDAVNNVLTLFIAEGPQGPIGDKGPRGDAGPQGIQGSEGPRGPTGPSGPRGADGPTGDKGPQGSVGPQGPVGPEGPTGPQGPIGPEGPEGPQGRAGVQGPSGEKGPVGDMGSTPLGLAFGRISIDTDGILTLEYYGGADANDFRIDEDGFLHVSIL